MITMGFVGCAHIHTPGFVRAIKARNDLKVKSVWDPNPARSKVWAAELGATVAGDYKSIYADPEIQAVVICSETNRHEELVVPAAVAKKHLFVEKPLGFTAKDASIMADAIDKAGVIFQTGYFRRGENKFIFLKEQVANGAFGKITRIRGCNCHSGSLGGWFDAKPTDPANDWRWMADPKVAGCGAFGDLGTHMLDIMIWLLGDIVSGMAMVDPGTHRYGDCDETGEGLMLFKNGAIGTLAAAWTDLANPMTLLISGTEGHAYILNNELFFISKKVEGADGKQPWTKLPENKNAGFEAFLDAITNKPADLVTAKEAAYRSAVVEALYEGAKTGKFISEK